MPINIYRRISDAEVEELAWLCDDTWDLTRQIEALELWLADNEAALEPADYVADVGISIRTGSDARAGGAALSPKAMAIMGCKGIHLFLSEYPSDEEQ